MKTYINGQHKSADTEMATKYQLSRAYTKVLTHINTVHDDLSSSIKSTNDNLDNLSGSLLEKLQALNNKDTLLSESIALLTTNTNNNIQEISSQVSTNISNINTISELLNTNVLSLTKMITDMSSEMQKTDLTLSSDIDEVKNQLSTDIDTTKTQLSLYINERDEAVLLQANTNLQTAINNLGNIYELKGFYTNPDNNTIATSIADLPLTAEKGDIYFITNDETGLTLQYICVLPYGAFSNERWQKFGTSVDLRKYATTGYVDTNVGLLKTAYESKCESISSTVKADITKLNNDITKLNDNILNTNIDLENISELLNTNINTLSTAIDTASGNIINTLTDNDNTVSTQLTNYIDSEIENLSTEVNTTNSKVNLLSTAIDTTSSNIINFLTNNDNIVSEQLTNYIDSKIENLGTVYELKGFYITADNTSATSINQLPTSAKIGLIYFILNEPTGLIEQYVCVSADTALAADKWQKFGTNVDLSNYNTSALVKAKDDAVLALANSYTDGVSSTLSTDLTLNILATAKLNLMTLINHLSAIYAPKITENIQTDTTGKPEFGMLNGNTIYDLNADGVITMLTFLAAEKSYLESIIYFKTGDEFTLVMPANVAYIQNGIEFDTTTTKRPVFKPNTRYIITVRNLVARIETIEEIEEPATEPVAEPEE